MSISGDEEVKTAVFDAQGDIGADELVTVDATEDRLIIGYNVTADGNLTGGSRATSLFLGTSSLDPSEDTGADNGKWQVSGAMECSSANGTVQNQGIYREGHVQFDTPSRVEWDEDETLSLDHGSSVTEGNVTVEVYYIEQ